MNHPPGAMTVPQAFRWRRRVAWLLGAAVAVLLAILIAAGSGVWWALRSDAGAAWLLAHLPGLTISGGKGTLWGDYEAERIELLLPGGAQVVMSGAGWRGLHVEHAPWASYKARAVMSELHARRIDVILPAASGKNEAAKAPDTLRLPIELDVGRVQVGELHLAALGGQPLRDLQARVHLGAERGTLH